MAERSYWSDVFTKETWEEAKAIGFSVSGFRRTRWNWAKRLKAGDILICYLYGHSRFVGALEVDSEAYLSEEPRIWQVDAFPARVRVKTIVTLPIEQGVPVSKVLDRLEVLKGKSDHANWGVYFQGSPRLMHPADGELILLELQQAVVNPVVTPIPAVRGAKAKAGVAREPEVAEAAVADRTPATREHWRVQALLLQLGRNLGLQTWVARGDRGHPYDDAGRKLEELSLSSLPSLFHGRAQRIVEEIDVLWLKGRTIVAAFEVEHTTEIFSGLLRLSDLIALQPIINIRLFVVAPAEREDKVRRELLRPTFAEVLDPPLVKLCRFVSYERLRQAIEQMGEFVRSLNAEDFLNQVSVSYLDDFTRIYGEGVA